MTLTDMQALPMNAFVNCTMIKEINLLCSVAAINENALGCANLQVLRLSGAVPETVKASAKLNKDVTVIVPAEYLDGYKAGFVGYNVISE